MESRDVGIIAQVVFKALTLNCMPPSKEVLKAETKKLIEVIEELSSQHTAPFQTRPVGTPRGTKVVGEPCGKGHFLVASKQAGGEAWCKECWKLKKGLS